MVLVCLALMSTQSGTGTRHRDPWQRRSQSHLAHVWDLSSRYDQLDRVNNVVNSSSSSSLLSLRVTLCWECLYSWRLRLQSKGRSFQKHGCLRFLLCWLVVSARFCRKTSLFSLADVFRSADGKCFIPRRWTIVTKQEMENVRISLLSVSWCELLWDGVWIMSEVFLCLEITVRPTFQTTVFSCVSIWPRFP